MTGEKITEDERRLAHIWKAVALRGATGLAFGGAVLAWPSIGLSQLAALIAAFALADGLATVVGAVRLPIAARERAWLAGGGLVGLATGPSPSRPTYRGVSCSLRSPAGRSQQVCSSSVRATRCPSPTRERGC
jgi:hypothetical protein